MRLRRGVWVAFVALLIPTLAALGEQRPTYITTLEGTCDFILPNVPQAPCSPSVMWMVLKSGRSALLFTYLKANDEKVTFSLSGGQDRQPNLENYYLSVDTLVTWFDPQKSVTTDVEGECHFSVAENGKRYRFVHCVVYNRRDAIMFKFNLNSIFRSETKRIQLIVDAFRQLANGEAVSRHLGRACPHLPYGRIQENYGASPGRLRRSLVEQLSAAVNCETVSIRV